MKWVRDGGTGFVRDEDGGGCRPCFLDGIADVGKHRLAKMFFAGLLRVGAADDFGTWF